MTALGANIVNMGLIGGFVGFYGYKSIKGIGKVPAIFIAAWAATFLASIACAIELAIAGTFPLVAGVASMALYHACLLYTSACNMKVNAIKKSTRIIYLISLVKFDSSFFNFNKLPTNHFSVKIHDINIKIAYIKHCHSGIKPSGTFILQSPLIHTMHQFLYISASLILFIFSNFIITLVTP